MRFKLTAEEVEKIINDITLNGDTDKAIFKSVSLPKESNRCMDVTIGTPVYMEDLLEIGKHFDDADIMIDINSFDKDLSLYIVPGEKFFEEGVLQ